MSVSPPVAFFIFRRPETTRRVFDAIARAKPSQVFIIADGPRNEDEALQCAQTRALAEHISWDCDVQRNYADTNMGLKRRLSTGLNWVFEQVEEAIILEDDCLPDPSFFTFCAELLAYYRDEPRVMHISGDYFHPQISLTDSYYFSRYPHVWGWATWRRAWQLYDGEIRSWDTAAIRHGLLRQFANPAERRFWNRAFDRVCSGQANSWAFAWVFACMTHGGVAINPAVNLVSNIGFDDAATHSVRDDSRSASLSTTPLVFPLRHPRAISPNLALDSKTAGIFFQEANIGKKVYDKLYRRLSRT
jgi:hypothetical protein